MSSKRPYEYLNARTTKAAGQSKELKAREIAERDGGDEGLICVFRVVELCMSYKVHGDPNSHRLVLKRAERK